MSGRGGKREGAGRHKELNPKLSKVVRVDVVLIPVIDAVKERFKSKDTTSQLLDRINVTDNHKDNGELLADRVNVTNNHNDLSDLVDRLKQAIDANAPLVSQRDKALAELHHTKDSLRSSKGSIASRNDEIKRLKAQLRKYTAPILGEGEYDGSLDITLAVDILRSNLSLKLRN